MSIRQDENLKKVQNTEICFSCFVGHISFGLNTCLVVTQNNNAQKLAMLNWQAVWPGDSQGSLHYHIIFNMEL